VVTLTRVLLFIQGGLVVLATLVWAELFAAPLCVLRCPEPPHPVEAALTLLVGGTVVALLLVGGARMHRRHWAWWAALVGVVALAGAILFVLVPYDVENYVPLTGQAGDLWYESPAGMIAVDGADILALLVLPGLNLALLLCPTVRRAAPRRRRWGGP
jgi:hypothetical protein